jgi:hypothetical protein
MLQIECILTGVPKNFCNKVTTSISAYSNAQRENGEERQHTEVKKAWTGVSAWGLEAPSDNPCV